MDQIIKLIPVEGGREALASLCRKYHIQKLAFYGSVVREDFHKNSDVDVLVAFEDGNSPGWDIVDIVAELSRLFNGRKVDIATFASLRGPLKKIIGESYEIVYEKAA